MSRNMNLLEPKFRDKMETLLGACRKEGIVMVPFFTYRSHITQARLWRQSRTTAQIQDGISMLQRNGADYLAQILEMVGPHHGRWATNALPGQSWHQHGLAVDCYWEVDSRAEWSGTAEGYRVYSKLAEEMGLVSLYPKDSVHVQGESGSVLQKLGSWDAINEIMYKREWK